MRAPKRIIIMAGGTGGHIFPGLAVARYLITQGWQVRWLGTIDHMEAKLVPKYGIDIDFICINGFCNNNIKSKLMTLFKIINAIIKARYIMRVWRPSIVLGMGGYVSGPGGIAAWTYGIPLVLHEQNSIAGLTNRLLSKISCKILQAYPNIFPNADIVGNPIRDEILTLSATQSIKRLYNKRTGPIRVLVIGGSQGAQILNYVMPIVTAKLHKQLIVWHQVGENNKNLIEVSNAYVQINSYHKIVKFIHNIALAYAWADIVICRSGALTVSEISAVGLPAIFVPFMHKDRQQYWNALPLVQVGAAIIIEQKEFTVTNVTNIISNLNRNKLFKMAKQAKTKACFDTTKMIAQKLESIRKTIKYK